MRQTTFLAAVCVLCAAAAARAAGPVDDAVAAYRAGDFEKAATIASQVPEGDPARAKALYVAGEAGLARKRWDDAARAFEAVLAERKDNVPALTGLGRAQAGRGERDAAEKTLRRACELDAKDALAQRALGEVLLAADRVDEALKALEAAWKLDAKDPLTARSFVEAQLRKGSVDAAARTAAAFASAAPKSAMAWFLKGLVLDRQGETRDAVSAYEKALAADGRFLDAHRNLAVLFTTSNAMYSNPDLVEKACAHAEAYVQQGGEDARLKELLDQIRSILDEMKKGSGGGRR